MMLTTHGTAALRSGGALLEADYRPGDVGPGLLMLRLEDQQTFDAVEGAVRLDPWMRNTYPLIELVTGRCFLLCGAQAVVALDSSSLAWRSSVGLEYQEGETIDEPWHVEVTDSHVMVLATERRVWCVDAGGAIRWLWSCVTSDLDRWITGSPAVVDEKVHVPLRTLGGEQSVELRLGDGLPDRA